MKNELVPSAKAIMVAYRLRNVTFAEGFKTFAISVKMFYITMAETF